MSANRFLPYGRQTVEDDDIAAVAEVLRSDFLTTGPLVKHFEDALAALVDARFAVSCSSGTAALHLAAMALDIGRSETAIVPTMTFLATANAVRYVDGEVVFADCDPDTGLMTPQNLTDALVRCERPPKAIFPVHLNGQPCEMPAIHSIAREHGAAVAEDACHALGGSCVAEGGQQNPIGACADSDMAVFSFHPVKLVAMGEGGVVTTNDAVLQERLARLRTHGMEKDPGRFQSPALAFDKDGSVNPWYYEMAEYGFNYRVSDVNCALGLSQLRKMDRFLNRRKELAALYDRRLGPLAPRIRPVPRVPYGQSGWHIYAVLIDFATAGVTRAQAMNRLRERGIGTQVHYLPVHMQPYYQNRYGALELPGARAYYERILSLPFYPGMEDEDVERVVKSLEEVLT